MEDFPKEYEDIYTAQRTLKKCDINKVSTGEEEISTDEYTMMMKDHMESFHKIIWDNLVKSYWLMRKFHYGGKRRRVGSTGEGITLDGSYAVFTRFFVGYDYGVMTSVPFFGKIASYFDDYFPDFDQSNPFEEKYEYPFNYVTLDFLYLVNRMPERLELLEKAEEKKLTFSPFIDYVLNYISVYNERYGPTYEYMYNRGIRRPYIKYKKPDGE